jgi:YfiR/HmsC-like
VELLRTPALVRCGVAIAAIWAALCLPLSGEQRTATAEDDIKAAFLFNFTQFVEWPAPADAAEPFGICVVADPAFGQALDRTVHGESVGHRPIVRSSPAVPDAVRGCQMLFIGREESDHVDRWLAAIKGQPVLVVGESAAAWSRGVHINFVVENNHVKFDVNQEGAAQAGLVVSSKLLRVARTVMTRRSP